MTTIISLDSEFFYFRTIIFPIHNQFVITKPLPERSTFVIWKPLFIASYSIIAI